MKNLFIILMLFVISFKTNAQGSLFSVNTQNVIILNDEFVENVYDDDVNTLAYNLTFGPIAVSVGSANYIVRIGNYSPNYYEGDFNVVSIEKGSEVKFLYREDMGILRMTSDSKMWPPSATMSNYAFREQTSNGFFIEQSLSDSIKALIFFGQSYGTDVGKLFIFILTESDVKLVFNKKMSATQIGYSSNGNFQIILQSNIQETANGVTWTPATTHTIWLEDGVLKFKDNN